MKGIKKALGGALLATGLASFVMMLPQQAFAAGSTLGWKADEMVKNTTGVTGMEAKAISQADVAAWVTSITTWILGLAIVFFVLKVVLTAIDRMLFQNQVGTDSKGKAVSPNSDETMLNRIPFVGAYPQNMPWKEIWIHFGKNIAIVAGAWVLVNLVVNVILWLFGVLTTGNVN